MAKYKLTKFIIVPVIALAIFAVIGSIYYMQSRAATPFVSAQAEQGTRTCGASVSDAAASGGQAVAFKACTATSGSPGGRFYIVGSDVIGPDGKKYYPIGANLGVANAFDWKGVATGHSDAAVAWGWNTIRLTVACTNRADYNTRTKDGYAGLRKQVTDIVNEYTAKKIVVIVECHDPWSQVYSTAAQQDTVRLQPGSTLINTKNQSDVGKSYKQQLYEFWTDSGNLYKSNPYVWFNFFNEPFGSDNAAFISLNNEFYGLVRKTGAENIAIADMMNSGNDAGAYGSYHIYNPEMGPKLAAGKCNMMFSLHAYGWNNNETTYKNMFDQMKSLKLATIVGEFGYTTTDTTTAPSYSANKQAALAMFKLGPQYGNGLIMWSGTHGDNYSLKADGGSFYSGTSAGANLSTFGQTFWTASHNKPNLGAFTGSYADSRCSTTL